MTHQGRVHKISGKAEEISQRIVKAIPREELVQRGIRRPICSKIEFQDTSEEKRYLTEVAERYNSQRLPDDNLIAHGTQGCSTLCQILLDGELRHIVGIENYGNLAMGQNNILIGGYWDYGWGVFVTTPRKLRQCRIEKYLIVPIQDIEAVLLPNQVVELVKKEFPEHANKLKSYLQFGEKIERRL
ncbi:MAG: hypothetical protein N3D20_03215 [Candidatus Pacearchaeota archaeon]|nr:hypothetical protein [Candidatus Pacearchaeota archaeon]